MISIFLDGAKEQPGFHVDMFLSFTRERHLAIDKALHDRLIAEGEACVARQSGWEHSDNQDGHFGGRGERMI
ncbi:hypothetical protein, partial [Bradyrhizobium sp. AUGA SZCCT0283]|uniref:hypothetical protein n=1 Tax=Bradyrhizobium sp. AUGA SZCCT0283 TaxID=2807671 RepID=UPI001BA490A8